MKLRTITLAIILGAVLLGVCLTSCVSQGRPAPQGDLFIFHRPTFEFIYPDTKPADNEITSELSLTVTPGEISAVSFAVLPTRDIANATVRISDLEGANNTRISAADIDPRVVQVWERKALRNPGFTRITVPEALVKDDAINFLDRQYTLTNLPSVPREAPVRAQLVNGQAKWFFLIVHTPERVPPGSYTGLIRVGAEANPAQLRFTVKVLPFRLRGPGMMIGMYYNDNIGQSVPVELYRARLQQMHNLGVNCLRILARKATLAQELDEIKAAGFIDPIIVRVEEWLFTPDGADNMRFVVDTLREKGYAGWLYGVDEPNNRKVGVQAPRSTAGELAAYQRIRQVGGLVSTALTVKTEDYLMSQGQKLDLPLYTPNDNTGFKAYVQRLQDNPGAKTHEAEAYYFGSWTENPRRNRLLGGFYAAVSQMQGYFCWTLYSFQNPNAGQVFDDFGVQGAAKRWFTMMPIREGLLPTVQSEALRAGISDLRYLNTFNEITNEREREVGVGTTNALRQDVLATVSQFKQLGQVLPEDQTASQYDNRQFDDARDRIVQSTLQLLPKR